MLTEVAFCLSCYFAVLVIEYVPLVLENPQLDKNPVVHKVSHNMHDIMAIFAALGVGLSCFHQGSLGGVAGVLFGRPFAFREHVLVWPWTFFLFTWSAAAYGPCFTIFCTKLLEKITGKKLVKDNVIDLLAKISGWMMATYIIAKIADTYYWATITAPSKGQLWTEFYTGTAVYGKWILFTEIIVCGVLPALILLTRKGRNSGMLWVAIILAIIGVSLNRWVMVLQTMAIPVMPFDTWELYMPTIPEIATTVLPVAYGVIMVMLSYRYLPIFPQEKELNPVDA